jgi:hypothetical protein
VRGDEDELFRAYNHVLMRLIGAAVRVSAEQTVEDACAFAWAKFLESQPDRDHNWKGWLFRISSIASNMAGCVDPSPHLRTRVASSRHGRAIPRWRRPVRSPEAGSVVLLDEAELAPEWTSALGDAEMSEDAVRLFVAGTKRLHTARPSISRSFVIPNSHRRSLCGSPTLLLGRDGRRVQILSPIRRKPR